MFSFRTNDDNEFNLLHVDAQTEQARSAHARLGDVKAGSEEYNAEYDGSD